MNDVQHHVPVQSTASLSVLTLILCMHTSTASFIIQHDVVACSIACWSSVCMRTSAAHVCALGGTLYCKSAAHDAETLFSSMPALSSVQAWAK